MENPLISHINQKYPIQEAYRLVTGRNPSSSKVFCPMHDNRNTPAAKIYGSHLMCFGLCNRRWSSYDLIKRHRPDIIEAESKQVLQLAPKTNFLFKQLPPLRGKSLPDVIKILLSI